MPLAVDNGLTEAVGIRMPRIKAEIRLFHRRIVIPDASEEISSIHTEAMVTDGHTVRIKIHGRPFLRVQGAGEFSRPLRSEGPAPYPVIDQMPGSFVAEGDQPWFDGRRVNMGYKTMGFI